MKFKRGEIVWVRFPFSDATSSKMCPALVVSNDSVNNTHDYLLMQITTRLRDDVLSMKIDENAFAQQPLLKQSELRLHKIFVIHESLIQSSITSVSDSFMQSVIDKFVMLLQ